MTQLSEFRFRFLQLLVAIDQTLNCVIGLFIGGSWADETISSRAYREFPRSAKVIDTLLWFDKDHCRESYESEQLRLQLPPELRQP